jgi:competence protein ComEC
MASSSSAIDDLRALPAGSEYSPPDQRRAPLAWVVAAIVPGIILAHAGPEAPPGLLVGAALPLLLLAWRARTEVAWGLGFLTGTLLLAWAWSLVRQPVAPEDWNHLPPREITAEGRVLEVYPGKMYPDRQYAFVEWTSVPAQVEELAGQRAFASLRRDEGAPLLGSGSVVRLRGVVAHYKERGGDEFTRFLEARGAFFRLSQGDVLATVTPQAAWRRGLASLQARWSGWLTASPPERAGEAHLLGAMLMGERKLLSPEQEHTFLVSGTMHLFAISGLHVMVVALTLQQMLQFLPLRRRLGFALVLVLLFLYVGATGFSPSAVRAFSMMAFYWLAGIVGRPPRPLPAVLASAVFVLLFEPGQLFSIGFQLSYCVVLSILLLGLPLGQLFRQRWPLFRFVLQDDLRWWQRALRATRDRFVDSLCISLAATVGSAPLIVLHFGVWTPGAILLNTLLVPLAALVVVTGVLIVCLHTIGLGVVAGFFAHGAWLVLWMMERIVALSARTPGTYAERGWAAPWLAYGILGGFLVLLFLLHEPAASRRLRPLPRLALPVLWVLVGLWAFTGAV